MKKCLNCNYTVSLSYCPNCGQETTTHRFSLKQFFLHAFKHSVVNLDKGFLYTTKELFIRPGHSIREFIKGKRIKHFNYFAFILLIITVSHYLEQFTQVKFSDLMQQGDKLIVSRFEKIARQSPKIISLSQIPLLSILSFLFFKKAKQNYTEHLILNTYKISAEFLIVSIFTISTIFISNFSFLKFLLAFIFMANIIYSVWYYYQYFSAFGYNKKVLFFKSIAITVLYTFMMINFLGLNSILINVIK